MRTFNKLHRIFLVGTLLGNVVTGRCAESSPATTGVSSVAPQGPELGAGWGERKVIFAIDPLEEPAEFVNDGASQDPPNRAAIVRDVRAALTSNGSVGMAEIWYHYFSSNHVELTVSRYPDRKALDTRWKELSAKFDTRPIAPTVGESAAWLDTAEAIRILVFRQGLFTGWVEGVAELGEPPLLHLAEATVDKMAEVTGPHMLRLGDSVYRVEHESVVTRPRLEFVQWAPNYAGPEAVFRLSNPGDRAILVWNVRKQVAVTSSGETTWVTRESDYPGRGWNNAVITPNKSAEFPITPSWGDDWRIRLLYSREISETDSASEVFDGTYESIGPTLRKEQSYKTQPTVPSNAD